MQETREADLIPGLGRFPGERHSNPLQYSCLENHMDRGAWWATVYGVSKSRTRLSNLAHVHAFLHLPTDTHTRQVLPFDFQKLTLKIYFKDILHTKDRNYLYIILLKVSLKNSQPNLCAWCRSVCCRTHYK